MFFRVDGADASSVVGRPLIEPEAPIDTNRCAIVDFCTLHAEKLSIRIGGDLGLGPTEVTLARAMPPAGIGDIRRSDLTLRPGEVRRRTMMHSGCQVLEQIL